MCYVDLSAGTGKGVLSMSDRAADGATEPNRAANMLRQLLGDVVGSVGDCLGAGVSVLDRRGGRVVSTVGVADRLDPVQWTNGEGPLVEAAETGRDLVLPVPGEGPALRRWPALGVIAAPGSEPAVRGVVVAGAAASGKTGAAASGATGPLAGERDVRNGRRGSQHRPPDPRIRVLCSLYLTEPPGGQVAMELGGFARTLARIGDVVADSAEQRRRSEQLREMVEYRRVIEQAKGLVMAVLGVDATAAFATLTRASQHFNVRLRHLAIALVEHVGGGRAEVPESPLPEDVPSDTDRRAAVQVWAALVPAPVGRGQPAGRRPPASSRGAAPGAGRSGSGSDGRPGPAG